MSLEEVLRSIVREEIRAAVEELVPARGERGEDPEWLSNASAAARADVSVTTIKQWCRDGKLKKSGEGRARRIRRADLDAFLSKQSAPASVSDVAASILRKGRAR